MVAAFIFGWLLRSPADGPWGPPDGPESGAAAELAADEPANPPPPTTAAPPTVALNVALSEAVPGFTDTLTILNLGNRTGEIMRWNPNQRAPETAVSFDQLAAPWFRGLDASGNWFLLHGNDRILSVATVDNAGPAAQWPPLRREAIAVRVRSSVWHDSDPGRLAWADCPRDPGASATIRTLDLTDGTEGALQLDTVEVNCDRRARAWLLSWGDWGFLIGVDAGRNPPIDVLFDATGTEIARSDRLEEVFFVAGGPEGSSLWADYSAAAGDPSAFRLSANGTGRNPVPGVSSGESLTSALWSPSGDRLAVTIERDGVEHFRIVDPSDGAVVVEIEEVGWVRPKVWSTDGRFLGYERRSVEDSEPELALYDLTTGRTTTIPLPNRVGDIRATP